jgi:hypothetical protein
LQVRRRADRLVAETESAVAIARQANQTGDNYVFAVVLFTSVVFFAGIQTKIESRRVRVAMLAVAGAMLVVACGFLARLPVSVGF